MSGKITAGSFAYFAGTAGTVTVPKGGKVIKIITGSTAGGSLTINGGASIPVLAAQPLKIDDLDDTLVHPVLVFTGTNSYYVEYLAAV